MSFVHESAVVHPSVVIPDGAKIWAFAHVREGVVLGENCVIGRNVYIGPGVRIGKNCKIQNDSQIYEPAQLGNGVFVGPGVILTNDKNPRAVNPDGSQKSPKDWQPVGVTVLEGASLGAGSICIAPLVVGRWAVISAGSVATKDLRAFGLYMGTPARLVSWVGRAGYPLVSIDNIHFDCPKTGEKYKVFERDGAKHLEPQLDI
jgi:UDP-2-acetamido-3-amino-2,3-dideoxy-glucuronate N-acetyltransferase